jgi:putative hydrolase of the HAD superfamily
MIKFVLFDLDNTLYSSRYGLEEKVAARIREYLARCLGVSAEEAAAERRKRIDLYGTTVEWLIAEKGFTDIEDYYRNIHPEDEAAGLPPDPDLKEFLKSLPCPLAVLTNAPMEHAVRIMGRLGIEDCFAKVFDMRILEFKGKPRKEAFRRALDYCKAAAEEVLFIDDVPRYVEGFLALGGRGILFDEHNAYPAYAGEKIQNLREITRFFDRC